MNPRIAIKLALTLVLVYFIGSMTNDVIKTVAYRFSGDPDFYQMHAWYRELKEQAL